MTLQNGLIYNRTAYLWTDTLMCGEDRKTPIRHITKTFMPTSRQWAAVFSGTAPGHDIYLVPQAVIDAEPKTIEEVLKASITALRKLAIHGLWGRLLLAMSCKKYGARLFVVSGDALPFAAAYEPYETVQFMSSGNGMLGAPCDPETPDQMRQFIRWQDGLIDTPPIGGDLIELQVCDKGVKPSRYPSFFQEAQAA